MKTHTTMLSSLAIAALATVTFNSTEALAKSGGGGGGMRSFSSARSFSAVRTSPVVIKQFKTVTTPSVKKLTTTKLTTVRDHRIKPAFLTDKKITLNPQPLPPGTIGPIKNPPVVVDPSHPVVVGPIGPIKPPGGGVVVDPVHPPAGPIGPIKPPGGGGVIVVDPLPPKNPPAPPAPPAPPPVVDHPHSHPSVSVGLGVVAAPAAVEPAGCTYERSVRKLPGGGLQRVIIKVCPDA